MEDTILDQESILDSRLTTFLQKEIRNHEHAFKHPHIKKFRLCGSQRALSASPAIFLVTKGTQTSNTFCGLSRCHSSWGCPTCTPKRMAEYGTRIAAAIDALKTKYNQTACMITLTLPHKRWMKIEDAYTILQNSWRQFARAKRSTKIKTYTLKKTLGEDKRAVGVAGEQHSYKINLGAAYSKMCSELNNKHTVRVYEFTWSKMNGWHPHIHMLFWVPTPLLQRVGDWEKDLNEQWWKITKVEATKYYHEKFPDEHETTELVINSLYSDRKHEIQPSVTISKDKYGKIRPVESSHYISGWGGDMEVSNERKFKRAAEGHYSPYQILAEAYKNRDNAEKKDYWLNLYFDYLKVTHGRRRVQVSKSGINKIAADWMLTEQWVEVLKKKHTDADTASWKVVCWFSDEQWARISFYLIQSRILEIAHLDDARERIKAILNEYDIQLEKSFSPHWFQKFFEKTTIHSLNDETATKLQQISRPCTKRSA